MSEIPIHFADRLVAAIDRAGAPACIGLDPVGDRLPAEIAGKDGPARIESFCMGVLDAAASVAPAVKPQSACFERFGEAGIADQGKGIAKSDQERIFEKFERLEEGGGAGLGLAIARRLARSMGGEVSLLSAPGEGARFTLSLPLA